MTGAVASRMAPTAFAWWTSRSTRTKLLIRALVSVAVLVWVSLVLAQPADAAGLLSTGTVDDLTVKGFSSHVGNYLVTNRWSPVSFAPSGFLGFGSVATYGAYTIQTILVGACMFLARFFMGMIYLTSGGDLVSNSADTIDRIFAKVGNGLLGNDGGAMLDGNGIMLVGTLCFILLGMTFWQYARQGGSRKAGQTFLIGFGALMLLVVVSSAAASNAKATDVAAASAGTGGRGGSTLSASRTLAFGPEPAFASPKWFITRGNVFSAFVGDTTQKIFTSISDSFDASSTSSRDECERYVAAMHATYVERSGPEAATHLIVAFDQLLATTLWDNERVASMGGATESSDAAWCRYSEMEASAPMIDQVQLSRKAGLYSDIVGYNAVAGRAGAGGVPSKEGTAVTAKGEWKEGGQELAASIFGPAFSAGDSSARAQYFWAACQWDTPGGEVALNPAWANVKASAAAGQSWWENAKSNAKWGIAAPIAAVVDWFNGGASDHPGNLGDYTPCQNVVERGLVASDGDAHLAGRSFQYGESYFLVDTLRIWNLSAMDHFEEAVAEGDTEAYDFYRATQGLDPQAAFLGSLAAVTSAVIFMRLAAPIALGLLGAQVIGILAWILMPIALVALIVPVAKTRSLAVMVGKTVLMSIFAAVLFQLVLQFALIVYTLVITIMVPTEGNSVYRWVLHVLATAIAFFLVRKILKSLFTQDLTTMRGSLSASTQIANRPLMSKNGGAVDDNYGMKRPGWMSRTASQATDLARYEGARSVRSKLADRFGDGPAAPAGPAKSAETTPKPATPAAKGWRTAAGTSTGAGGVGGANTKPTGSQARGQYALSPDGKSFAIPKDGTISAAASFPPEAQVLRGSKAKEEYAALSPGQRGGYIFDPASGRFLSKAGVAGMSPSSLSRSINAPVSAIGSATAPEGVSQEDWDLTKRMRAEIASDGGMLAAHVERRSLIESVAADARKQAAATGHPLPTAPEGRTLADQAPGVASAPDEAPSGRAVPLRHHANGQVAEGRFEGRADGLRATSYREDGTVESKLYERDGARVERAFDSTGTNVQRESWTDASGSLHRIDGPAVTTRDRDGNIVEQQWALGGEVMQQKAFDEALRAARDAVSSADIQRIVRAGGSPEAMNAALGAESARATILAVEDARATGSGGAVSETQINAAVSASVDALASRHSSGSESGFDPADVQRQVDEAISSMGGMSEYRREEIVSHAAQAVVLDAERFAAVTNSEVEHVRRMATQMLEDGVNPAMEEQIVRLVNAHGDDSSVERMRDMIMSGTDRSGVGTSRLDSDVFADSIGRAHSQMDSVVSHVKGVAEQRHDERTSAVSQRLERELSDVRQRAEEQSREIESDLAQALSGLDMDASSEASSTAHRLATRRRGEVEERLVGQMGHTLDGIGLELSHASVDDESLEPLRAARRGIKEDFDRVRGVRGWFRH